MTKADLIRCRDLLDAHLQESAQRGEPLTGQRLWDARCLLDALDAVARGWETDRPEETPEAARGGSSS